MNFEDLGLSEKTIKAIKDLGYKEPTAVQKDVIPSVLSKKDVFTIAPASCGKTCSYIFPLIDIISQKNGQTILIIAADDKEAVNISDKFSVFNKYHEANDKTSDETSETEANVIIASPDLLLDNLKDKLLDLSSVNILVVDDINLIKKKRQLPNLNKVLELLPADKQNIVFTTRRSKETQDTLNKILKTPEEIKIDKNKESELTEEKINDPIPPVAKKNTSSCSGKKRENKNTVPLKERPKNNHSKAFGYNIPAFLLLDCNLASETDSQAEN